SRTGLLIGVTVVGRAVLSVVAAVALTVAATALAVVATPTAAVAVAATATSGSICVTRGVVIGGAVLLAVRRGLLGAAVGTTVGIGAVLGRRGLGGCLCGVALGLGVLGTAAVACRALRRLGGLDRCGRLGRCVGGLIGRCSVVSGLRGARSALACGLDRRLSGVCRGCAVRRGGLRVRRSLVIRRSLVGSGDVQRLGIGLLGTTAARGLRLLGRSIRCRHGLGDGGRGGCRLLSVRGRSLGGGGRGGRRRAPRGALAGRSLGLGCDRVTGRLVVLGLGEILHEYSLI